VKTREDHERRLAELLNGIDFSGRYYAQCDAHPLTASPFVLSLEEQRRLVAGTGLEFDYDARERFFGHREQDPPHRIQLNIVFGERYVEPGLSFRTGAGVIGGPFHVLAHDAETLARGPGWEREPRYPRLRFVSTDEAERQFAFGIELFRDARPLILAEDWE
jgi:hypothetical protein